MPKSEQSKEPKPKRVTNAERLIQGASQPPGTENFRCQKCQLCDVAYGTFVQPGPEKAGRILIVHGFPWENGSQKDGFAMGYQGYLIKHEVLAKAGVKPGQVVFTGVVRCLPTAALKVAQVDMCSAFLEQEVRQLKPTHIIGFGAHAVRAITRDKTQTLSPLLRKPLVYVAGDLSIPALVTYSVGKAMEGEDIGTLDIIRKHVRDFLDGALKPKEFLPLEVI